MNIYEKQLKINSRNYLKIVNYLKSASGQVRLIGGIVRDSLLGIYKGDVDIVTDLLPEQVIEVLKANKVKVIPIGIKFGTVGAYISGELFEITTLRSDFNCDGRHANVSFTNDFAIDASRRDFTINAAAVANLANANFTGGSNRTEIIKKHNYTIGSNSSETLKELAVLSNKIMFISGNGVIEDTNSNLQ